MAEKQPPRGRGRGRRGPTTQIPQPPAAESTSSDEGISSQPAPQQRPAATSTSSSSGPPRAGRASSRGPGRIAGRGASRGRGRTAAMAKSATETKKAAEDSECAASSGSQLIPQTNTKSSTSDEQAPHARGMTPQDHHVYLARRPGYGVNSVAKLDVACNYYKCKGSP